MSHRSTLLAILAGAFVATPLVVLAAGGASPAQVAPVQMASVAPVAPPSATVVASETPALRTPAACGRKVRVIYPGYQPPAEAACAPLAN